MTEPDKKNLEDDGPFEVAFDERTNAWVITGPSHAERGVIWWGWSKARGSIVEQCRDFNRAWSHGFSAATKESEK